MSRIGVRRVIVLFVAASVVPPGCSRYDPNQADPVENELKAIHEMYLAYLSHRRQPPKKAKDLNSMGSAFPAGADSLRKGRCVLLPGGEKDMPAETVICYQKETPEQGGFVLRRDGKVVQMSAAEFEAAPKAGKN